MQALAGVLFEMQPLDADGDGLAVLEIDRHRALADHRRFVLADLIALRQIGIEIVLPVENRLEIDLRFQSQAGADRLPHAFLVDHRQHAGHGRIDQRDMAVRRAAELGGRAGKEFRLGRHLRMHFHADDDFPVAGRTFQKFLWAWLNGHVVLTNFRQSVAVTTCRSGSRRVDRKS